MKRIINILLCTILSLFLCTEKVQAADMLWIEEVNATFLDEHVEVTRRILEVDGGMSEMVKLEVKTRGGGSSKEYILLQYDGQSTKEIVRSTTNTMQFDPTDVDPGKPVYLTVKDNAYQQTTKLVNFRIHPAEASKHIDPEVSSSFGDGIVIDLSGKLPGCKLSFLPFAIPVTVKKFGDGRLVLGIGCNASDVKFWNNARQKKFPATMEDFEKLKNIVLAEENEGMWQRPKNVGLLFSVSGWIETTSNPKQPGRGQITAYIGTGWATGGQYAILTWDVIVTIGASGGAELSLVYNDTISRSTLQFNRLWLTPIGALEAFGGIGLYNIASVGIYGAGSLGATIELFPLQGIDSVIIAGELGFKVKVFGKSIVTFTLVSGAYDFINDKLQEGTVELKDSEQTLTGYLLANDYANTKGETLESGEMIWHNQVSEEPLAVGDEWEGDRDFAHLLAEDVYPDSHVQIVNTGSRAIPQMNAVFLAADNSRVAGNRSVAMNSYYNIGTSYMSDPYPIDDNGTADFEPEVYRDPVSDNTYAVWKDAREEITEDMYLADIASRTEIEFAEFQVGRDWKSKKILTDYKNKLYCATGATVSGDEQGNPVVSYFETPVGDPLALSGDHDVYLCVRDDLGNWHNEKQFTLSGHMNSVRNFWFRGAQTIAATTTDELGVSTVSLWQNGEKIWEKTDARAGQFAHGGNNRRYFIWYSDGRFYVMDNAGNEKPLTPEDIRIPNGEYEFSGTLGSGKAVLIGKTSKNNSENAIALISPDGGSSWFDTPITELDTHAIVDHVSVAFTDEDEPVVIYSVQNYVSNFDESRTDASTYFDSNAETGPLVPEVSLAGEDFRFTDTQADLYIKARGANTHLSLREGYVKDVADLVPGGDAEFIMSVYNNGLYPVDHAVIRCAGKEVGVLDQTIMPGETAEISAFITLPEDPGRQELVYTLDVISKDNKETDSRIRVTVPGGHLEAAVDHIFEDMKEQLIYSVTNYGYTEKDFEVVVRDEDNNREITREKYTLKGGESYEGACVSKKGMYAREGCTNATIYVLYEGEDYDSPSVEPNRIKSVVPLEEIYGQPLPVMNQSDSNSDGGSDGSSAGGSGTPVKPYYPMYNSVSPVTRLNEEKAKIAQQADSDKDKDNKDSKDSENSKDSKDSKDNKDNETSEETIGKTDPENGSDTAPQNGEKTPGSSRVSPLVWVLAPLAAAGGGGLWFILAKRRKEEEE